MHTSERLPFLILPPSKPTRETDTTDDVIDKMHSGNYLISAINHVIDKENHECFMEIIKDSLIFDLTTGKTS